MTEDVVRPVDLNRKVPMMLLLHVHTDLLRRRPVHRRSRSGRWRRERLELLGLALLDVVDRDPRRAVREWRLHVRLFVVPVVGRGEATRRSGVSALVTFR